MEFNNIIYLIFCLSVTLLTQFLHSTLVKILVKEKAIKYLFITSYLACTIITVIILISGFTVEYEYSYYYLDIYDLTMDYLINIIVIDAIFIIGYILYLLSF